MVDDCELISRHQEGLIPNKKLAYSLSKYCANDILSDDSLVLFSQNPLR